MSERGTAPFSRRDPDEVYRSFQWFTPRRRRATVYEDVTIDTQPSVARHMDRGWPLHFEDGRPLWNSASTALRCDDWHEFRDPREQWERTFYQKSAQYERGIEDAVRSGREDRLFEDFTKEWIDFLRAHLQVPAFVEYGLWLPTASAQRECLSDTIAHCVGLEAATKQRQAQALALYGMDLEEQFGDFAIEQARETFLRDPSWQPVRDYLERLLTVDDWGEVIVAANVCFEPLVGIALRRELLLRSAAQNGDLVTPEVVRPAQLEWDWVRDWTGELLRFVILGEEYGSSNRTIVKGWIADWLPRARAALAALEPVFAALPSGDDFGTTLGRVERDLESLLEESGVGGLAEAVS